MGSIPNHMGRSAQCVHPRSWLSLKEPGEERRSIAQGFFASLSSANLIIRSGTPPLFIPELVDGDSRHIIASF